MPRIPPVSEESLTPAQRRVYDKVLAGPRGVVVGPLRAVLHSPELADRWQMLGEYLRFNTCLAPALSELAIIAIGRYFNCQLEWLVHATLAREAGVADQVIEAIRTARTPEFIEPDEAAIYEFTRELLERGQVASDIYQTAYARFGVVGVVELTALVGYYTMVAMMLNAHQVPLPATNSTILSLPIAVVDAPMQPPTRLAHARLKAANCARSVGGQRD